MQTGKRNIISYFCRLGKFTLDRFDFCNLTYTQPVWIITVHPCGNYFFTLLQFLFGKNFGKCQPDSELSPQNSLGAVFHSHNGNGAFWRSQQADPGKFILDINYLPDCKFTLHYNCTEGNVTFTAFINQNFDGLVFVVADNPDRFKFI